MWSKWHEATILTSFSYLSLNSIVLSFLLVILKYAFSRKFWIQILKSKLSINYSHRTYPSFTHTQSLLSSISYTRIHLLTISDPSLNNHCHPKPSTRSVFMAYILWTLNRCLMACIRHYSIIQNHFAALKFSGLCLFISSSCTSNWQPLNILWSPQPCFL